MTWDNCSDCGREIAAGETAWTVNVHEETFDGEEIDVLEASCLQIYCETCAGKRDFDRVSVPVSSKSPVERNNPGC